MTETANLQIQGLLADDGEFRLGEGQITSVDHCGRLFVTYRSGCVFEGPARTTLELGQYGQSVVGLNVILAIPNSEGMSPIILGVIEEAIAAPNIVVDRPKDVGETDDVMLKAANSLSLKCGKGEIVIRRNGEIVVRGIKIVSRAAKSNKIKGATVLIN